MSIDQETEERCMAAIEEVNQMGKLWPKQRERIFKNICRAIMLKMGWKHLYIGEEGNDKG